MQEIRKNQVAQSLSSVCVLAISICCSGCSSEETSSVYPASVEILYPNGTPLARVRITCRSVENKKITATGRANLDGVCRLTTYEPNDGAVLGEHEVVVVQASPKGDRDEIRVQKIAPRFASYSTSQLTFTVTENEADNKFTLTVTPE